MNWTTFNASWSSMWKRAHERSRSSILFNYGNVSRATPVSISNRSNPIAIIIHGSRDRQAEIKCIRSIFEIRLMPRIMHSMLQITVIRLKRRSAGIEVRFHVEIIIRSLFCRERSPSLSLSVAHMRAYEHQRRPKFIFENAINWIINHQLESYLNGVMHITKWIRFGFLNAKQCPWPIPFGSTCRVISLSSIWVVKIRHDS